MDTLQSFSYNPRTSPTAYLDDRPLPAVPQVFQMQEQAIGHSRRVSAFLRKPVSGQLNTEPSSESRAFLNLPRDAMPSRSKGHTMSSSDANSISTRELLTPEPGQYGTQRHSLPLIQSIPNRQRHVQEPSDLTPSLHADYSITSTPAPDQWGGEVEGQFNSIVEANDEPLEQDQTLADMYSGLIYAHQPKSRPQSKPQTPVTVNLNVPQEDNSRPNSTLITGSVSDVSLGVDHPNRYSVGKTPSPAGSPVQLGRQLAANRGSPNKRMSYVDLLQVPYVQQVAPVPSLDNSLLRTVVGNNASLLDTSKTLDMYRANVKKTADPAIQYEFAIFMVQTAMDISPDEKGPNSREDRLKEARQILHKLADRGYPFAQYYLGDGYASGLFNKGKQDCDHAFPLFVAASKHGHAESGYRAALCYEFGWGCRKDFAKAVQFFRAAASKNHPGAATRLGMACIEGTMGLKKHHREGIKWLKRAAESADFQYNAAPYELGRLHEKGYGDDIFQDEIYAAQLFTQSADLGHPEANLVMGKAYEHGRLKCPIDPALSIHFYNGAAQTGLPEAMMALCAWYLFGADPILPKDENEAFEWAKRASAAGYPKADYAIGYFKEIGIGTRQDALEANVWYVQAAQKGEKHAIQRLAIIQDASIGGVGNKTAAQEGKKNNASRKGLFSKLK